MSFDAVPYVQQPESRSEFARDDLPGAIAKGIKEIGKYGTSAILSCVASGVVADLMSVARLRDLSSTMARGRTTSSTRDQVLVVQDNVRKLITKTSQALRELSVLSTGNRRLTIQYEQLGSHFAMLLKVWESESKVRLAIL